MSATEAWIASVSALVIPDFGRHSSAHGWVERQEQERCGDRKCCGFVTGREEYTEVTHDLFI